MKTIILDMFGVIIKEGRGNFKSFLAKRKPEADYNLYITHYKAASLGQMPYRIFMGLFGFEDPEEAVRDYVRNFLSFDPDFVSFAESCLKSGFRLALLSNDIAEFSKEIRKAYGIEKHFDLCIISSEAGMRKPDKGIFTLALEKLRESPENCLFTDDNPGNISAAATLGMKTALFRRDGGRDRGAVRGFGELCAVIKKKL